MVLVILLAGVSSRSQTTSIYWNFTTGLASPTSGSLPGLATPTLSFGNAGTLSFNNSSPSAGYTTAAGFAASGDTNATLAARSVAFSLANSSYFTFAMILAPTAGSSYTVTDISFGSRQTSSGPTALALYESNDGFNADVHSLGTLTVATSGLWVAEDFSGIKISLPDNSTSVAFRIYGSGGTSAAAGNWRMDDLAVTVAAAPEPMTLALAVTGGLAVFCRLRFKSFSQRDNNSTTRSSSASVV